MITNDMSDSYQQMYVIANIICYHLILWSCFRKLSGS